MSLSALRINPFVLRAALLGAAASASFGQSKPDLIVTRIGGPATGVAGDKISGVTTAIRNIGGAPAGKSRLEFMLSTDRVITRDDIRTGWGCTADALPPNSAEWSCGGEVAIPAGLKPGTYYIGAYADWNDEVDESNETNNGLASATPIVISPAPGPDLAVTELTTSVNTVKPGETTFDIAMDAGVPWDQIAAANGLKPGAKIKPGQKLVIPTIAGNAAVIPSPTISTDPPKGLPDTIAPAFAWPLQGKVRRAFAMPVGTNPGHEGIDLLADEGTAVRASAAGTVIFAGQGPDEYGLTVIVYHSGRWTTTYSYLGKITVKEGDKVKAGTRIGLVGQTGLASEPQLHFEIRRNKVALDPARYLKPIAQKTAPIAR